jgi:hypothetical protein
MRWTWGTWVAVVLVASGCSEIDFSQLIRQHAARIRIVPEAPGAHCERGGQAVQTGLDLDDDGQLDDNEVTSTEYACAAQPADVLVRTQAVPPGAKCVNGGQVSHAGLDTNGDGLLQDNEITSEVYSCTELAPVITRVRALTNTLLCPLKGTAVEAGADVDRDGVLDEAELQATLSLCSIDTSLVRARQNPEPSGVACPLGGTKVEAGQDLNGNDVLDEAEATATAYLCQPTRTYDGSYVVKDAADLAALQGVTRIHGSLIIQGPQLTDVALPGLAVVDGTLTIDSNAELTRVDLGRLRFVGDMLNVLDNPKLAKVALGSSSNERLWVESVLVLARNPALPTLSGLRSVVPRESMVLESNDALQTGTLDFVEALTVGLTVRGNPSLQGLPTPNLQTVGSHVVIANNDALPNLQGLAELRIVGGQVEISDNDALLSLKGLTSLDSVGSSFSVVNNRQMTSTAGLAHLRHTDSFSVIGNPALVSAGDLPQLKTIGTAIILFDNPVLGALVNLPELQTEVALVNINGNPVLTDLSGLRRLQRVERLTVAGTELLTGLSGLASLRNVPQLFLLGNQGMTNLGLEGVVEVSARLNVQDNPKLPRCQVTAFADRVYTGEPDALIVARNDDTATCPPPPLTGRE